MTGDPAKSLLIKAVRYKDENLRMPPDGEKLTEAQVAELEAWVKMEAPLPRAEVQQDKIEASAHALGLSTGEATRGSDGQEPKLGAVAGGRVYPGQT